MAEIVARGVEMASPLLEQRTQALSVNVPAAGCGCTAIRLALLRSCRIY